MSYYFNAVTALVCALPLPVLANAQFDFYGVLDAEYTRQSGDVGSQQGAYLANAEFGVNIHAHPDAQIQLSALYEEDLDGVVTELELDEAHVSWQALDNERLRIQLGRSYVPFGEYETVMITDPLPQELAEMRKDAVLHVQTKQGKWQLGAAVFSADSEDADTGESFEVGAVAGVRYHGEVLGRSIDLGVNYLSNLAEADVFESAAVRRQIPAISIQRRGQWKQLQLRSESVFALKALQTGELDGAVSAEAKPSAHQSEVMWEAKQGHVIAAAWNRSNDAQALGLPKRTLGIAYRHQLNKHVSAALEWQEAEAYDSDKNRTLTTQLTYEF